ncbi:MAG: amidohydrolase [Clostridia bacterium]|nr:amidohydrolase [Clostridia bacterium]
MNAYTIIDFHTHTFPEKIAAKAITKLEEGGRSKAHLDGTLDSLIKSNVDDGIDYSVSLPVATSAKQVRSINRLSAELNGRNGVFFGGAVHPECENIKEILDYLKESGIKVIKIHPDYQGTAFDDEKYIKILREAAKRDIITVTHAGVDLDYPDDIHCTPQMILNVLEELKGVIDNKLVLAHFGGNDYPDEALGKLCGKPVYFDTAYSLPNYPDKCREIIRKHGADKILFATDSPWVDRKEYLETFFSLGLSENENRKILGENAAQLLGIKI